MWSRAQQRSRQWRVPCVVALMMALVWATGAFGQGQTTGRITGKVVDETGKPVSGATVTANHAALSLERTGTTNENGDFVFALLPTGTYTITVMAEGRQPEVYNVGVSIGQTIPLEIQLAPGMAVSEAITVSASMSSLETTTVGETFDYPNQIETLPVINRGIMNVASLAPNVAPGPNAGSLNIAGAPAFDTTVLLDGAEISDPYFGSATDLYLEDAIQELQVMTSGVTARYGRFMGGVINAVTKSGTNEFEGTVRAELESEGWDGGTPYGEDRSTDVSQEYQATVGGPVIRDRIWFFGGLWTAPVSATNDTTEFTNETITTKYEEERWHLKLRAALTPSHMVEGSYFKFDSESGNRIGLPAGNALAVGVRRDPRSTATFNYQGVFGSNTYGELQLTQKKVSIIEGGDPSGGDPFIDYNLSTVFNNGWWDAGDASVRDNETLAANIAHSLSTARFGAHEFEAGVQRVNSITGGENQQSPTGYNLLVFNTGEFYAGKVNGVDTYNLLGDGYSYRWKALSVEGQQELVNDAFYVQDTMTVKDLRLDLGLRFDAYDGSGPLASYNLDFSGWQPRLGVTYNVAPRTQLQGTYGRYISRFNDNVANSSTGVSAAPRFEHLYTGPDRLGLTAAEISTILRDESQWGLLTDYISNDQPTTFQASDINAPYADDYNFSIRQGLPRDTGAIVLTYLHRDFHDLIDAFVGGACDYGIEFGQPCPAGSRTIIHDPVTGRVVAPVDTTVWANEPRAKREYRAITATWEYRPTRRLNVSGNYTYGTTKGNYEGEARNQPASGTIFGNYERSQDMAAAAPFGYTDDDVRHRLIAQGAYTFDFHRFGVMTVGSIFRYQSGLAYSITGSPLRKDDPAYVSDANTRYTYFFGPNGEVDKHERGSRRFNGWSAIDLALRYEGPGIFGVHPFARLAVMNVLNSNTITSFQTSGTAVQDANGNVTGWRPVGNCGLDSKPSKDCTAFGRVRNESDYQLPRAMQLAIGLQF